jgi:hypothetical protein
VPADLLHEKQSASRVIMHPLRPFLRVLVVTLVAMLPCRAAVSILITPGSTPDTSVFTITQTAPAPVLPVAGTVGYVAGIALPTAMFDIPGSGSSSDIFGDLSAPVGTVTELSSGEMFQLSKLQISSDPSRASVLGFDRPFIIPIGAGQVRFALANSGPVEVNVSFLALRQGIHSIQDTAFGPVTVTIVPEPSTALLLVPALAAVRRRRRH